MYKLTCCVLSWASAVLAMTGGVVAYFVAQSEADKWLAVAAVAAAGSVLWKGVADAIDD